MIEGIFITIVAQIYILAAIKVARVAYRKRMEHGYEPSYFASGLIGLLWPLAGAIVGILIIISGDAGIYSVPQPRAPGE